MRIRDTFSPRNIDSSEVMSVRRYLAPIGWAVGMLVLILDGRTAMTGAAEGLRLCIQTLIPSLFPFFLLSGMLTSSLSGGGLLLTGILSGYPVGAANTARAYRAGELTKGDAERMVVLCSCAGPSFIFGVVSPLLGGIRAGVLIWFSYLVSILLLWLTFPPAERISTRVQPGNLQQALFGSIRAMAGVCGWVVIFRVVIAMADRWVLWLLPEAGRTAVYGILELSNGCLALAGKDPGTGIVLAAGFISFGGICVMLQTAGVAEGISLRLYLPGKLFQSAVSMLIVSFFTPGTISPLTQTVLALSASGMALYLRKTEKRCGNPCLVIV